MTGFYVLVFASSLAGSWHCVGMCSPFACAANMRQRGGLYHIGRGLSYIGLGAFWGGTGQAFRAALAPWGAWGQILLGLFFLFLFIFFGMQFFFPQLQAFRWLVPRSFAHLLRRQKSLLLHGLLNGFLPCGWLYQFFGLALASNSAKQGMAILFLFWLGTIPALTSMGHLFLQLVKPSRGRLRLWSGGLFIFSGAWCLAQHFAPLFLR